MNKPLINGEYRWPKGTKECLDLLGSDPKGWQLWKRHVRTQSGALLLLLQIPTAILLLMWAMTRREGFLLAAFMWAPVGMFLLAA